MITIFFDMDDTLYDQIQPFQKAYDEVFGNRFDLDIHELFEARSVRGNEVFEAAHSGKMPMEDMHIYRIQKAFADLGYKITDREALAHQKSYEENQDKICMTPAVCEALELCSRQGIPMGILSNGPSAHQWKKLEILKTTSWIARENIVISGDCGMVKPNTEIFRYAQKKLGVKKEDCILVGDNYESDIAGAKKAGWRALWLNKRSRDASKEAYRPDYEAKNEEELLDWVKALCRGETGLRER